VSYHYSVIPPFRELFDCPLYLSKIFPVQDDLKQGDTLLLPLFNLSLEYAVREVQENQVGLKLDGIHHLLVNVDGVNLLGDNIDTVKKNRNFKLC
jgi:hypothetical protein